MVRNALVQKTWVLLLLVLVRQYFLWCPPLLSPLHGTGPTRGMHFLLHSHLDCLSVRCHVCVVRFESPAVSCSVLADGSTQVVQAAAMAVALG